MTSPIYVTGYSSNWSYRETCHYTNEVFILNKDLYKFLNSNVRYFYLIVYQFYIKYGSLLILFQWNNKAEAMLTLDLLTILTRDKICLCKWSTEIAIQLTPFCGVPISYSNYKPQTTSHYKRNKKTTSIIKKTKQKQDIESGRLEYLVSS